MVGRVSERTEVLSSCAPVAVAAADTESSYLRPSIVTASWVLADNIIQRWRTGQPPNTLAALTEFPHLELDKRIVVGLAYEEYCLREKAGEVIDDALFCARFPEHRAPLLRLLVEHKFAKARLSAKPIASFQWPKPGEKLEHYHVIDVLGRGTFAFAYLTFDPNTQRPTVVKASVRGEAEARLLGPLEHEAIVPIWSATTNKAGLALVSMPFLGIATLHDLLDEKERFRGSQPTIADALRRIHSEPAWQSRVPAGSSFRREIEGDWLAGAAYLAWQLASGLEYLHNKQVRHCDLKPSNILLRWDGRPVILDFNLAEDTRWDSPRFGGTAPYMAPELIQATHGRGRERSAVDGRSDVYSLGVVCYELFTGKYPFGDLPKDRVQRNEARQEYSRWLLDRQRMGCRPLCDLDAKINPALAGLIERCLNFDPCKRPTAGQLAAELQQLCAHDFRSWPRRRPRRLLAVVAALTLAVVLVTGLGMAHQRPVDVREMKLGQEALAAHRSRDAELHFEQVLRVKPDQVQAHYLRGIARLQQNDVEDAMGDFVFVCRDHADGPSLTCLAYCLTRSQNHSTAIARADEAEKLGEQSAALFNNRGVSHLRERGRDINAIGQKLELARLDFHNAIQKNKHQPAPYYNRAFVSFLMYQQPKNKKDRGYLDDAQADILRALEEGPLTGEPCKQAAVILFESGYPDLDRIMELLHRAVADGVDPSRFDQNTTLKRLKNNPKFQQLLLERPGHALPHPPCDLIIPPIVSNPFTAPQD
jgi:tetratricopeptide (TPR) repeat protein